MLLTHARIITNDQDQPFLEQGAILVQGDSIQDIGPEEELLKKYPDEERFDAQGRLVMPGMINAHTHIYSAYARGMAPSQPTTDFFTVLENLWWRLDRNLDLEDSELSAYITMIESIRNGVTTLIDHHSSPNHCAGSLFKLAEAAKKIGMRSDFCYECSDRDGERIFDEEVQENIDFIKAYNTDEQDLIHAHFGMHASFTLSQASMEKIAKAMQGLDAGYHIHVAEGIEDEYDSLKKYGKRIVNRLFDLGMLGPKTLAIHCVHASPEELQILKDTDTSLVHNPLSNMNNAVGVTPVVDILRRGIRLGLGTDAYTHDMFESMHVAKILQPSHLSDCTVGFGEALQMQFVGNPAICETIYKKPVGVLKKGAYADLICLDYKPFTPFGARNWQGHCVFGMYGRMVNDNMINGQWVMRDRKILTVDEDEIFARSMAKVPSVWKNM